MLLPRASTANAVFAPAAVGKVIESMVFALLRGWISWIWGHTTRSALLIVSQVEELARVTVLLLRDAQLCSPNLGVLDRDLETTHPHGVVIVCVVGPYGRSAECLLQLPCR